MPGRVVSHNTAESADSEAGQTMSWTGSLKQGHLLCKLTWLAIRSHGQDPLCKLTWTEAFILTVLICIHQYAPWLVTILAVNHETQRQYQTGEISNMEGVNLFKAHGVTLCDFEATSTKTLTPTRELDTVAGHSSICTMWTQCETRPLLRCWQSTARTRQPMGLPF